jgi:hypothetical protein
MCCPEVVSFSSRSYMLVQNERSSVGRPSVPVLPGTRRNLEAMLIGHYSTWTLPRACEIISARGSYPYFTGISHD